LFLIQTRKNRLFNADRGKYSLTVYVTAGSGKIEGAQKEV